MFLARRHGRIVVDKEKETCYVLEVRSKTDRGTGYGEEATDRAKNRYGSLMERLEKVSTWKVHLTGLVKGRVRK